MKTKLDIHLHTNYSCNLNCRHCYNNSGKKNKAVMPIESVINIIIAFYTEYDVEIHMEGGEIFLLPELLMEMNNLPLKILKRITITTNGTINLTNPKIISMLSKIAALRVSVEGHTNELQQAVREIDLDSVLELASYYQSKNIPIWLRITLNNFNYGVIVNETIPYMIEKGFNNIQIYEFQNAGRGQKNNNQFALGNSIYEFLVSLESCDAELNRNLRIFFPQKRVEEILEHEDALIQAGLHVRKIVSENSISIHADGAVFICPWDNSLNHRLFNVLDQGVEYVLDNIRRIELTHSCSHCSAICIES